MSVYNTFPNIVESVHHPIPGDVFRLCPDHIQLRVRLQQTLLCLRRLLKMLFCNVCISVCTLSHTHSLTSHLVVK